MAIIEDENQTVEVETSKKSRRVSRRAFMGGTGALVVGFSLPRYIGPGNARAADLPPVNTYTFPPPAAIFPVPSASDGLPPAAVDTWVRVGSDNTVTIMTGKCELGTGTATATLQIAADQLNVSMDQLKLINPDTWRTADQGVSSGSQTMLTQWNDGVRQACAAARAKLLSLASTTLGVPLTQLTVNDGIVSVTGNPNSNVSYAELIGNQTFDINITASVQPVDPIYHNIVGQSVQRIDIPAKVAAKFEYVQDIKVPGMLHGRVVRPPTVDSTLVSVDTTPTGDGVVAVVVKDNFIGVVAETEWAAINAAENLKPVWNVDPLPVQADLFDELTTGTVIAQSTLYDNGAVAEAIAESPVQMSAQYFWPYQIHGPIGPPCAVADVHPGGATVWSGTQGPYPLRGTVAGMIGLPVAAVHVIYVEASGCYGLDGADNCALDAVLMSQAVGAPVRVQYMRKDEQAWENYGQAMAMEASAGMDTEGNIQSWQYAAYTMARGNRPNAGFAGNIPTGGLINQPVQSSGKLAPPLPPTGPDSSNAATLYTFERQQVLTKTIASRFYTGPMRAPNRIQNTFANESFMDELAYKANMGPLAFRLKYISDPRMIAVLQQATTDAKWDDRVRFTGGTQGTGQVRTGWGMAGMRYEGTGGYAALVVNVSVDMKTGVVSLNEAYGAQDCGICINPDGMVNQAEGCVMQGISRTLTEELRWTPQGITTVDWLTYPITHFSQMPKKMNFSIISNPENPVLGAGEVMITATPAAIANAIFDATGLRLRWIPFTPQTVLAAIKANA